MSVIGKIAEEGGGVISKAGPWAVLSLLLILGLGYEGHLLINHFATRVTAYVETSDRNLAALLEAQRVNAEAHAMLTTSIGLVAVTLAENTKAQSASAQDIRQLKDVMNQAYEILKKQSGSAESPALNQMKRSISKLSELPADPPRDTQQ